MRSGEHGAERVFGLLGSCFNPHTSTSTPLPTSASSKLDQPETLTPRAAHPATTSLQLCSSTVFVPQFPHRKILNTLLPEEPLHEASKRCYHPSPSLLFFLLLCLAQVGGGQTLHLGGQQLSLNKALTPYLKRYLEGLL